jgi:hypothetical protein
LSFLSFSAIRESKVGVKTHLNTNAESIEIVLKMATRGREVELEDEIG